jgi:hypothetical protein
MGTIANILGFGLSTGPHYQLDYSTATSAGITTASQATLASSNGIASICSVSGDGTGVTLRSDVDVDPIASNGYPRTEWRELATDGTTLRSFNRSTGDHKVDFLVLAEHLPPIKPSFVFCQIHDATLDVLELAVQPRSDFATTGKMEVVLRIDSTGTGSSSSGIPRPVADFGTVSELAASPKWLNGWVRVGAIAPGSVAGWQVFCNGVLIQSWDAGMPVMWTTGASGSYFKSGMYLQTKWTGSGTGGLETDRNEYGQATWRVFKTTHPSETAPVAPVVGSRVEDTVSGVTWGAKASNKRTVAATVIDVVPALPTGLADRDMMGCIIRCTRGITSTGTAATVSAPSPNSAPSTPTETSGLWDRLINTKMIASSTAPLTGAYPGNAQLQAHTVRWLLWAKPWVSGDAAPTFEIAIGNSLTDTITAQIFKCSGAKMSTILAELLDQLPAGLDPTDPDGSTNELGITYAAATSTTALGPSAATPGTPKPGSLALECLYHETAVTTGAVALVTGGTDTLSWAEGGEGAVVTISPAAGSSNAVESEAAFAHDWAVVPMTGYNQVIPAKTAAATISSDANKPNTAVTSAGKGWGLALTIEAAKRHRHPNRNCVLVG